MSDLKLPSSSYNELVKIIKAYSTHPKGGSLDDISHSTAMHRVTISNNSKFLVSAGIIEGGNSKKPTDVGLKLGRALSFKKDDEIERYWKEIVLQSEFLKKMLTVLNVKGGMSETDLIAHIEYASGQKKSKYSRAGSGAIVDIFKIATLINEESGLLLPNDVEEEEIQDKKNELVEDIVETSRIQQTEDENKQSVTDKLTRKISKSNDVTINLNIQLTVPETTDEKVYEKFFEAMKNHLLS